MRSLNRFYLAALLVPLLILALAPELRAPACSLVLGFRETNANAGFVPIRFNQVSTQKVLESAPDSLDTQIYALSHQVFPPELKRFERDKAGNPRRQARMLAFAELSRRHPDNALLLVQALLNTQSWDGRVAGPWENDWLLSNRSSAPPLDTPNALAAVPSFPHSEIPHNLFTRAEMILGLQLARRGQKLEAQNSFFSWMEARFLFALRRDAEAIQVLIDASRKTDFDMHWRDLQRASVAALGREQPLLAEEEAIMSNNVLLPHISALRHITHMALWCAMQKAEAGDNRGAFAIEVALARLTALRCERSFFGIERISAGSNLQSVWKAREQMRWARVFYIGKPKKIAKSTKEMIRNAAAQFIRHCLANNHPDIACETEIFALQLTEIRAANDTNRAPEAFLNSSGGGAMTALGQWWFVAHSALFLFLLALGSWLGLTLFGPLLPPRGTVLPRLNPRFVAYPLILGAATFAVLMALGARFLYQGWAGGLAFCGFPNNNGEGRAITCLYFALTSPPLFIAAATIFGTARLKPSLAPFPADATPEQEQREWENLGLAPGAYEPFEWFWRAQALFWFRALPLVALACVLYVMAVAFDARDWTQLWDPSRTIDNTLTTLFGALGGWLLALLGRWRFGMPKARRALVFAGFWSLRRTFGWLIPLSLWFLLIAIWGTQTPRRTLQKQLPQFWQSESKIKSPSPAMALLPRGS